MVSHDGTVANRGGARAARRRAAAENGVVDVTRNDGVTRIVVEGEVDFHAVGRLRSFVDAECVGGARTIVIDLSAVEFVDAHGLQLFADTHRRLAAEDRTLALVPPRGPARRAFVVTGLARLLDLEPGRDGRAELRGTPRTSSDVDGRRE